jgi:hypothetical protein
VSGSNVCLYGFERNGYEILQTNKGGTQSSVTGPLHEIVDASRHHLLVER